MSDFTRPVPGKARDVSRATLAGRSCASQADVAACPAATTRAEERAREVIGAKFRLGGRDPRFGLDCVGLVAWALEADAPAGYGLRGGVPERVMALLDARLARVDAVAPGDVLLFAAGPGQLHLAIASERGMIHADAGLRRVVERPGVTPWPVLGVWRAVVEQ